MLRGAAPAGPVEEDLDDDDLDAFAESRAVLVAPGGRAVPLYPLFPAVSDQEPLSLYDGHHGVRVQARQAAEERGYIYYLGTHQRRLDGSSWERLRELLAGREISFFLTKEDTAPWTVADNASDYSHRTLDELLGGKYFPACYVPFAELERHFDAFLQVPDTTAWPGDTTRRRHVNGFLLVGVAGAGKTAILARQVERLLQSPGNDEAGRVNPNLVLFLRGNGLALRPAGVSLFRDVIEKLGTAAGPSGFSSFRELLDHLHGRWKQDRVPGRRLVLVLDALNEAPFTEAVVREALEMVGTAACYPWCKIVLSIRQEWIALWYARLDASETGPLATLWPFLYAPDREAAEDDWDPSPRGVERPPVVALGPFTAEHAALAYTTVPGGGPGCTAASRQSSAISWATWPGRGPT